jgi:mRNA interferase YafQ
LRDVIDSKAYRKDYQREERGKNQIALKNDLPDIIDMLAADAALPVNLRDHALTGDWAGNRECHVRPNLLLVYQKGDDNDLYLVRLGSHSEIFG